MKYSKVIRYTHVPTQIRNKKKRQYKKEHWRTKYIYWLLTIQAIQADAIIDYYDLHHNLPLGGGGINDYNNFTLLNRVQHQKIVHNQIINPQIKYLKSGQSKNIIVPNFDNVDIMSKEVFNLFLKCFNQEIER